MFFVGFANEQILTPKLLVFLRFGVSRTTEAYYLILQTEMGHKLVANNVSMRG